MRFSAPILAFICLSISSGVVIAQADMQATNDFPNPYQIYTGFFNIPAGREWGATSSIDIDPDGKSIWIAERCGSDSIRAAYPIRGCAESDLPVVLKFNSDGEMVRSFGGGIFAVPHGFHVDHDGNIWVTDAPFTLPPGIEGKGHIVVKFSPDGDRLMTLGTPGVTGNDGSHFNMPSDVHVAPNGDIFVADGHGGNSNARIVKFDSNGNYLMDWGSAGSGPGQFNAPHGLAMDSQGRLFVADRSNNRIQIFDQNGNFLDEWHQFSRLSGIFIDGNDILYGVDSESNAGRGRADWRRGIHVGSARTGEVTYFIPAPFDANNGPYAGSSGGEGVVADKDGVIYSAEVGPRSVKRYVRFEN